MTALELLRRLALAGPHPSSMNKLDLIEGGRTFSQNLSDKCVHTGPRAGLQNKGQKGYLIMLYIKHNMKLLGGIILCILDPNFGLSIHLE